jgi:tetratricopeptide (TPR) repeat protein
MMQRRRHESHDSALPGRRWREAAFVVPLLAAHYALAYTSMLGASTTFDEPLHMVAGVAYWTLDDYRLQPENGNLPQRWCAIPLLFMNLTFPTLDQTVWRESEALLLGRQYLYTCGNDPQAMLAASRAMATVWSTALCLVVFFWSRSIFGTPGGFISLVLAAFWPAVVAHGPLATSDACGALFFTLGAWSLWELFHRLTPGTLVAALFTIGIAPIAKHSSVMLAPLAVLYLVAIAVLGRPLMVHVGPWKTVIRGRWRRTALACASLVVPLIGAVFFIWASCGFRYDAAGPGCGPLEFRRYKTLASCNEHAGGIGGLCDALAAWRLLPEGWIYGLSYVGATVRVRNAFAIGRYSIAGWWWYFPLCLAIKNTLPALVLAAWGVGVACRDMIRGFRQRMPLGSSTYACLAPLGMLVVLWPTFLTSHLNIGERHLLPSYPALMVLAGGTVAAGSAVWVWRAVVILVALHAVDVASRWPSTLAYFNQIVPRGREYRWLVDSNLDWGQDLLRLRTWLARHGSDQRRVYLDYFGSGLPEQTLPQAEILALAPAKGTAQSLLPGLYCVSASSLQAVYERPAAWWCTRHEETYQRAREYVRRTAAAPAPPLAPDAAGNADPGVLGPDTMQPEDLALGGLDDATPHDLATYAFSVLQAARLRAFLRHRPPDASVGGSILLFSLSAADLQAALAGPPAELRAECWNSGRLAEVAALVGRADALMDEGRSAEAIPLLTQACDIDDVNAVTWGRLALAYAGSGRETAALRAFRRAIRLAPKSAEPLYNRGTFHVERGRIDEGMADYDAALAADPTYRQAYFNRGVVNLRAGKKSAAIADFTRFRGLGGELPAALQPLLDQAGREPRP